jgi:hypothetical protein
MPRNEADTRILLIEPKLRAAGWSSTQVTRGHCCRRDQAYTTGRIYLRLEPHSSLLHAARIVGKISHHAGPATCVSGGRGADG